MYIRNDIVECTDFICMVLIYVKIEKVRFMRFSKQSFDFRVSLKLEHTKMKRNLMIRFCFLLVTYLIRQNR